MSNVVISKRQKYSFSELLEKLILQKYERVLGQVATQGSFRISGGQFEILPVASSQIIRVEYFGDQIERIYTTNNESKVELDEFCLVANFVLLEDDTVVEPGDYVVHIDHGVAIFNSFSIKNVNGLDKLYLTLEYLNGDFLYLPIDLVEKITKYIGVGRKPKLNRLGGQSWEKSKKKAYENALKMARELLQIYAKRQTVSNSSYSIEVAWDGELKKSFIFTETDDQLKAINDVYNDLKSDKPMDRLISGDVGFGKTEVALRAMVQAVANRNQAAIICPTTLLAQQHYYNIIARTKDLPLEIVCLSRFVDLETRRLNLKKIQEGRADIVVATHMLFSADVKFRSLDLLIIDEEQRFGVRQKEYFKQYRPNINVLSLSATPIPRTLFMSLSGIRDISQIKNPPKGRKEIKTEISQFSDEVVRFYVEREMSRGGQIYYLYNKVETIEAFKQKLCKIVPKAKIAVAHGQLSEARLSGVMKKYVEKEYDILLCSTIIENGLDLPNVNTLIVDNADNFGLSQLYQIRGRVGRSDKQAYCLLTHKDKIISPNAFKRLRSLVENSDLGSGINIALSDLEIRGGGNILGREQHGNMETVGLVLYSQMLKKAVSAIK